MFLLFIFSVFYSKQEQNINDNVGGTIQDDHLFSNICSGFL